MGPDGCCRGVHGFFGVGLFLAKFALSSAGEGKGGEDSDGVDAREEGVGE